MKRVCTWKWLSLPLLLLLALSGCATTQQRLLDSDVSQVQLRSYQSRAFDTTDREKMLRTIMATLQDLDFVIDEADAVLGSVSATKLNRYALRMSVTVRPRGETQLLVRANCQFGLEPVHEPEPYQQFFAALSKGIFLEAQLIDDGSADKAAPAVPVAPSDAPGDVPKTDVPREIPAPGQPSTSREVELQQRVKELELQLAEKSAPSGEDRKVNEMSAEEHIYWLRGDQR